MRSTQRLSSRARRNLRRLVTDRRLYFERCLKIMTKDSRIIPFRVNPIQARIDETVERLKAEGRPVRIIGLKARQQGFSTYCQGYIFHDTATRRHRNSLTVAHDDAASTNLFEMSRLMYDSLPSALKPMKRYSTKSGELVFENPNEAERSENPGLRSSLRTMTARNTEAGRSKTIQNLHLSEVAFWDHAEKTMLSLLQAVPDHPDTAVFIESTANGVGGEFYDRYWAAKRGETEYVALFFAWFDHPEYSRPFRSDEEREAFAGSLDDEEQSLIAAYQLTLEQLHWRRWCIANKCKGNVDRFRQEYPANDQEAFLVSGRPFFNRKSLYVIHQSSVIEPKRIGNLVETESGEIVFVDHPEGYLRVWKEPHPDHRYVIGADVAEGLEKGDYSAAEVIDRDEWCQVAEWHGHMDPDLFGDELWKLARWYNHAWLGIEANNHGLTTNKRVEARGYRRLYRRQILDTVTKKTTDRLGWLTTAQSRPFMLDELAENVRELWLVIHSQGLVGEMMTFVRNEKGRAEAQEGCFDDRVFGTAIALQMHALCPLPKNEPDQQPPKRRVLYQAAGY